MTPITQIAPSTTDQPSSEYRGKGKVAHLPKPIRDQLNQFLSDGLTYPQIIQRLGDHGKHLTPNNLSQWKKRGYKAWLAHQDFLDQLRETRENASDLDPHTANLKFPQAIIHVAFCRIFESLKQDKLDEDPANHIRQINALARLARTAAHLKKITDEEAIIADQNRPLSEDEIREMILDKADDILGCKSYRRKKPTDPSRLPPLDPTSTLTPTPTLNLNLPPSSSPPPSAQPQPNDLPLPKGEGRGEGELHVQTHPRIPLTDPLAHPPTTPTPCTIPSFQYSISPVRENCPRCHTLLPPRMPTGERPSTHCHRCGSSLHRPNFPDEQCPHCAEPPPPLYPNGQRPHPNCPKCKNELPPPPPPPPI